MKKHSHFTILLIFSFLIPLSYTAQTNTISDGLWNAPANWNNGVPGGGSTATINNDMELNANINIGNAGNYNVNGGSIIDANGGSKYNITLTGSSNFEVNGNVAIEGNLRVSNTGVLTIRGCDTMRVGGTLLLENNTRMNIESCAVLIIGGDAMFENINTNVIDGNLFINGNLLTRNNSEVTGNGLLEVVGEVTIDNSSTIFGSNTSCKTGPCQYGTGVGLPITLHSFSVKLLDNKQIQVDWQTASEINNDYFSIEASVNGKDYIVVKTVAGAGNSQKLLHYQTLIEPLDAKTMYIRLKQTDFDGQFEYFPPKAINMDASTSKFQITQAEIFPNPGNGSELYLSFNSSENLDYRIQILNLSGQLLKETSFYHDGDSYIEKKALLNGMKLQSGIYIIRLSNNKENINFKYLVR